MTAGLVAQEPSRAARRYHIVLNSRSGTVAGAEVTIANLITRFSIVGLSASSGVDVDASLAMKIRAALRSEAEVVVAAGGDGTISAVASAIVGTDKALAVLPLGTANLLARDLGIPLLLDAAIAELGNMVERRIDVAEVNETIFLHNVVLGFVPGLAAARERLRGRRDLAALLGFFRHLIRRVKRARHISAQLSTSDGRHRVVRAAAIAVSNNAYDEGMGRFFYRSCLNGGSLGIYILKRPSLAAMFGIAVRMLFGQWRGSEELTVMASQAVVIRSRRHRLMAMIDGEVKSFDVPLRVRVRAQALAVLAPAVTVPTDSSHFYRPG
jgi:diacylglycerol kinase family enzyme